MKSMAQNRLPDDNPVNSTQLPLPGMPGKAITVVRPDVFKMPKRDETLVHRCPFCQRPHRHVGIGVRRARCNGRNYLLCPGTLDCVAVLANSLASKAERDGGAA